MMSRKIGFLITLCYSSFFAPAQITDVFQKKEYEISTYVLNAEIGRDYAPGKLEILQDKNVDKNTNWQAVEDQLKALAITTIENNVTFFELQTRAIQQQKQVDELNRREHPYYEGSRRNPKFESIRINLITVINETGVYSIDYAFEDFKIKKYYLADYSKKTISSIAQAPKKNQQEVLKALTLSQFTTLYLLQTQKLDLNNSERIRAAKENSEIPIAFASSLDYSEAIVFPYFSGIMVAFPANSKSSTYFDNQAFRIFLKGKEVLRLLRVYPEFTKVFSNPPKEPTPAVIEALDNDELFNLQAFSSAPTELRLLPTLKTLDEQKNIFSLKINNYQQYDTQKIFIGSRQFYFDTIGNVIRVENRDDKREIRGEIKYQYNDKNQLTETSTIGYQNKLSLSYFDNEKLSYIEHIEQENYRRGSGNNYVDLNITQQHFTYTGNYRYAMSIDLVGDFENKNGIYFRYLDNQQYCSNPFCILMDSQNQVIGVKTKNGSAIDLLTDDNNLPIESYFDYDRYRYVFEYDAAKKIEAFTSFSSGNKATSTTYHYQINPEIALQLTQTSHSSSNTIIQHEYEVIYW